MSFKAQFQVKGVAVKSLPAFVELNFPDVYLDWLGKLESDVRSLYVRGVLVSRWYDADKFLRRPALLAAELLYFSPEEFGWKSGIFSSQMALHGIYKFFLRFGGPVALIKRVPFFLETYYRPADVKVLFIDQIKKEAKLEFSNFVDKDDIIIYRIMGWGYNTLLESGAKSANLKIDNVTDDTTYTMLIQWE